MMIADWSNFMSRLIACLLLCLFATVQPLCAQSQLVDRPRRELFPVIKMKNINPDTKDLAIQLEIWPLIEELYDTKIASSVERRALLRSKILETVLEAYFDAASIQAEADREQGALHALEEALAARRDKAIEYNNAVNFIASGTLNTIGSILGFSESTPPFPGNFNQMMSGVVSTGMSTYSLRQQGGPKTKGAGTSTIVAELYGRPVNEDTTYPESVWRFFHSKSMNGGGLTRAEVLENHWIARRHLEPHGSRREKQKIDIACGVMRGGKAYMTIDDLNDVDRMIFDVSTVAELMTQHLRDLLRLIDTDVDLSAE